MSEDETVRKFSPGKGAAGAFDLALKNPAVLVRTVGGWIGVQIAAEQAGYWGTVARLGADETFALWYYNLAPNWQQMIVTAPLTIVSALAGPAIAVGWHRFAILGERPSGWLSFDVRRIALYIGRVLQIVGVVAALSVLLVPLVFFVPQGAGQPALTWVLSLVPLAILVAMLAIFVRTGLAFPAAAVGDRACTLQASWNLTDGNGWRLMGGLLLVSLPFYVANTAISLLGASVQQEVALSHLLAWISIVVAGVGGAVVAGYYSAAYSFLVGAKGSEIVEHFK